MYQSKTHSGGKNTGSNNWHAEKPYRTKPLVNDIPVEIDGVWYYRGQLTEGLYLKETFDRMWGVGKTGVVQQVKGKVLLNQFKPSR